ncbi:acyltransferase family protein [Streptomyces boncukensis]|uniref:Acyltransferase n=1 Tax=Streptomyces boncukensis TaxID=2711219 RepID=A0A6G4WR83_9ACTN|nr:acyltransferase [Streptomyces boncukensis]
MRGTIYRPSFDGLRAVAVLSVLGYHVGLLPWGWAGVPLFFVLSGHFITRTLLRRPEAARGDRVRAFARNRLLRLGPLYAAFCVVLTALALADYGDGSTARNLPYLWTWTFDLSTMAHGFRPTSMQLYTHLWSLGVEVQVYVVWALLAILLPRRWFARTVAVLALAGPALRAGLWLLLTRTGHPAELRPMTLYTSPFSYVDAFAVGAVTALPELRDRLRRTARWIPAAFAAVTAALVLRASAEGRGLVGDLGYPILLADDYGWVWQYTVLALFFGAVVLLVGERSGRGVPLLGSSRVVRLGVISYGIYVVHVPLLGQVRRWRGGEEDAAWSAGGLLVAALVLVSAVVVAELSYRLLEQPFLRRKRDGLLQPPAAPPS